MSNAKNAGKLFEKDIKDSCGEDIFFYRIKDVFIPPKIQHLVPVSPNNYDCFVYSNPNLFCLELKSTIGTSLSFDESIVKEHQINSLFQASQQSGIVAGLVINFRSKNNRTFFIEINEYLKYKHVAQNKIKVHPYKSKVNRSSIPFSICEEIGIEIDNRLKRVHYDYDMGKFINDAATKYGEYTPQGDKHKRILEDLSDDFYELAEGDNYDLAEWSRENVPDIFSIVFNHI